MNFTMKITYDEFHKMIQVLDAIALRAEDPQTKRRVTNASTILSNIPLEIYPDKPKPHIPDFV